VVDRRPPSAAARDPGAGVRAALVPGVLALLPEYAGLEDPVAALRAACHAAVAWVAEEGPVEVVGTAQGRRVGEAMVAALPTLRGSRQARPPTGARPPTRWSSSERRRAPVETPSADRPAWAAGVSTSSTTGAEGSTIGGLVVVGNGSAKRGEGSPGYVDSRAVGFDDDLGARLRAGDLAGIDHDLARELWADTAALDELALVLPAGCPGTVDLEDDPYGVQYWVVRWQW